MYFLKTRYTYFLLLVIVIGGSIDTHAQQQHNLAEDKEYNRQLDMAIEWQEMADSMYHISVAWRKQADKMDDPLERGILQQRILIIEDSIQVYRGRAERHFAYLDQTNSPFIILDTVLHGIRVYQYNLSDEFLTELKRSGEGGGMVALTTKSDSGLSTEFEIYKSSPYNADHPFEYNFVLPRGIFYRIQLAVYSKEIPTDHFGGLYPITTEKIQEKGLIRFFAGKFTRLDNAKAALQMVRSAGFPDAYIIGYFDGVKGTTDKLRVLEKE